MPIEGGALGGVLKGRIVATGALFVAVRRGSVQRVGRKLLLQLRGFLRRGNQLRVVDADVLHRVKPRQPVGVLALQLLYR